MRRGFKRSTPTDQAAPDYAYTKHSNVLAGMRNTIK
jgi:hypothetical protein